MYEGMKLKCNVIFCCSDNEREVESIPLGNLLQKAVTQRYKQSDIIKKGLKYVCVFESTRSMKILLTDVTKVCQF